MEQADAIQPRLRIPLRGEPDGTLCVPSLDVAPDGASGGRLYVRSLVNVWSAWDHVLWWTPEGGSAGLLVSLVLMFLLWRRVRSRPRERGRVYCRGCNYELGSGGAESCPECGASPARVVRGRSRRWRLVAPLVVLAACAIACGLVVKSRLRPLIFPPMGGLIGPRTWPLAAMDRVPWMPKYCKEEPRGRDGQRIVEYDLKTGARRGLVAEFWGFMDDRDGIMTPDGSRYIVALQHEAGGGGECVIDVIGLATRGIARHVVNHTPASVRLARVSADSQRVYYQLQRCGADASTTTALRRMDLGTGASEEIGEIVAPPLTTQGVASAATVSFVVAETPGGVRWAAFYDFTPVAGAPGAGPAIRVVAPDGRGGTATLDLPPTGSYFYPGAISEDGATVYIPQWLPAAGASSGNIEVDLSTMTASGPRGSSFLMVRRAGSAWGRPGVGLATARGAALVSPDATRTWATLATRGMGPRGTGICSALAISPDLRRAAAVVGMMGIKADGGPLYSYEIEVWDLGEALLGQGIEGASASPEAPAAPGRDPGR